MKNSVHEPSRVSVDSEQMTADEFKSRFVDRLVRLAGEYDADGGSVAEYAAGVALTYFEEDWQREDGPEACAESEFSYWEGE